MREERISFYCMLKQYLFTEVKEKLQYKDKLTMGLLV